MDNKIKIAYATMNELDSWMQLIETVRWNFPGLETQKDMEDYRDTVIKNINRKSAVCALDNGTVVGFLLFSVKNNMLCQMAVHPDYRRQKIASQMIEIMLENLDRGRDIEVHTFRKDDEKGIAPRALYKKLGFEEAEPGLDFGYPIQKFILRAK